MIIKTKKNYIINNFTHAHVCIRKKYETKKALKKKRRFKRVTTSYNELIEDELKLI